MASDHDQRDSPTEYPNRPTVKGEVVMRMSPARRHGGGLRAEARGWTQGARQADR
jgi:hypothetical protein